MGLRFYSLLLQKRSPSFDNRKLLSLISIYRFCVLGVIISLLLAVLLLASGIVLKIILH